ncbi:right-handed parallel beta-helix repeat-containing protein [Micromonospora auratinigra]|uniref:Right handed beta helix region n=1 Tax=Micromonospora auratinigra TaxID=261654 RepID=A0A1A8Z4Y1_9ACTN|nr:right-handed parallel beta-helix repeat-containing protein [Micromonospora auratinigra]SBT38907.1 Right handed beta helix region [Micromonospora auratinigra]
MRIAVRHKLLVGGTAVAAAAAVATALPMTQASGASGGPDPASIGVNATNLSLGAGADGSSKASGTSYGNAIDGDMNTYWSPAGSTGRISVKWDSATTVGSINIREAAGAVGAIHSWRVVNNDTGATLASGTGAGIINFAATSLRKINFEIASSTGTPRVAEFETYASGSTTPPATPPPTTPPPTTPPPTTPPPSGSTLYVAPTGADGAAGTQANPTTLTSALTRISAGGTIYLRGGTYRYAQTITIGQGNNGTSSARKNLFAYPGETPILNFSAQSEDPANRGLAVGGSWWHIRGIVVERAGDNGILLGGSNNIIERTVTRYNRDSGLQLSRLVADAPRDQWPSNNLVVSTESHDNADSDGEDADGFAPKLTVGPGNVFRYTVSHNNIDDGYDLFTKPETGAISPVTIESSLAYDNGTLSNGGQAGAGDRNGFKLGGEDIGVNHVVRGNIAYHNGQHGFTYNRNLGSMTVSNNASIGNTQRNFNFDGGSSVFRNNTSCDGGTNDRIVGNADSSNQFWSGTDGSRCAQYSGALGWSFASDGRLVVTFGGRVVTP